MMDRWMRIQPHSDRRYADIHICNRGKHRDYTVKGKRYKWLIDWVRESAAHVLPWFEDGGLLLEVYL